MSRVRSSIVGGSLVAVGLATGVALGVGPLDEVGSVRAASQTTQQTPADRTDPVEQAFVDAAGARMLEGRLDGRTALVVTLPGARDGDADRVAEALRAAGATTTGEIALTARLLDPGERQYAVSVAEEAAKGVSGIPASEDAYARVGAVIARAYAGGGDVDGQADNIRTVVTTARLVEQAQPPEGRADLVVLVGGPARDTDREGTAEVLGGLLDAWDAAADGVVLTAPEAAGFDGGLVRELRRDGGAAGVSTFDGLDAPAGAWVTAEVAVAELGGEAGTWGTGDGTTAPRP